ncbi:MAG: FAD-binding protein [Nitrososphaeria archaeon]|nr:FAD-binding protein [Nitrososphaeria archaeon]
MEEYVCSDSISVDYFSRINYALDGLPYEIEEHEVPFAVVRPRSTEEISSIMALANQERFPVVVRGGGTGLHGGTRPKTCALILDTTGLESVEVDEDNGYVEVGSGVRCITLNEILLEKGYHFPVVPGSEKVATLGGVVGINTSGHSVDSYVGKPGDYVLGLEVVLSTGEVIDTGSKTLRRMAGPDLTRLFIGSEGKLGIITKIRLRLVTAPRFFKKAMVTFKDVHDVARSTMSLYKERAPYPLYLEFMDPMSTKLTFDAVGLEDPGGPIYLIVMAEESSEDAESKLQRIVDITKRFDPIDVEVVDEEERWEKIWLARQQVLPISSRKGPVLSEICDPPLSRLVEALDGCLSLKDNLTVVRDVEVWVYGHIGAPSIHIQFNLPPGLEKDVKKAAIEEMRKSVRELNLSLEGSYGEQGYFPDRGRFFLDKYGETGHQIILGIKKLLDPNDILNPGHW